MTTPAEPRSAGAPLDLQHPFPGLHAYGESDREFFFGRADETEELARRVRRGELTVLFGASGLGKTSLLNAGLFPQLRETHVLPVLVRLDFGASSGDLVGQVRARAAEEIERHGIEAPPSGDDETLWEYFHRARFWNRKNRLLTPVLVFDQFEEIFTLGRGDLRAGPFLDALGDVVENRIPDAVRNRVEAGEELPFSYERQKVKSVISLREDFLPHLEDLRDRIPSLGTNRLRLTRMGGRQALEAVLGPGREIVDEDVAREVVRYAAGRGSRRPADSGDFDDCQVEPALLNLICRELNILRVNKRLPRITRNLLAGAERQIIPEFYARSLKDMGEPVRTFIEDHLLTESGFRKAEPEDDAVRLPGVDREAIDRLVDRRVVRREERLGIPHVELVHDVLTPVVVESRTGRRRRAAARRRRRRLWIAAAVVAVVVVVVFTWGLNEVADARKLRAANARLEAQTAATEALNARLEEQTVAAKAAIEALEEERKVHSEEINRLRGEISELEEIAAKWQGGGSGGNIDELKAQLGSFDRYTKEAAARVKTARDTTQQTLDVYSKTTIAKLVSEINGPDTKSRRAATDNLTKKYASDPIAIELALDLLEQSEKLTVPGRINALFFLRHTDPSAWTPELARRGLEVAKQVSADAGKFGKQTQSEIRSFRKLIAEVQSLVTSS